MPIVLDGIAGITTPEIVSTGGPLVVNASAPDNSVVVNASGNVGIGTSSPAEALHVNSGAGNVPLLLESTDAIALAQFKDNSSTTFNAVGAQANALVFYNDTERARIDSSGTLLVGKTASSSTVNGIMLQGNGTLYATSNGDAAEFYRKTTDGTFGVLLIKSDVGGTASLKGIAYANGTFGAVSDARMKKNVENSRSYLQDIMSLRVVKYNWTTDEDETPKELGWIAQEVEQVFPGMVNEMGGSKLLKKEVFLPMLMKCVQELKAINDAQAQTIELLTARVVALEQA